jgi:hypothetical protein
MASTTSSTQHIREYQRIVDGLNARDAESVVNRLVAEADWTTPAARELVSLAQRYGSFMLSHATALAEALDIEDGEAGF